MTENNTLCAYAHQAETTNFITNNPCCLVTSDPGTGKTRSVLDHIFNGVVRPLF